MDRSLDEIIAERPQSSNPNRRGPRRGNRPRDGVKKSFREDRVDPDLDWVHDKFEDDRDSRRPTRGARNFSTDHYVPPEPSASGARIRVNNLHYDLTEDDLRDLFTRIGPIVSLSLVYDRAGRSEGLAFVTYKRLVDAQTAIREFDGANAKGQPIRLTLMNAPRPRNPFDTAEKPKGSLFDRTERPRDRNVRSLSPESDGNNGHQSGRGRGGRSRHSRIDRYTPGGGGGRDSGTGGGGGGRSPRRRTDGGGRRERNGGGRQTGNVRAKKTQEELDQEMEDYWGGTPATAPAAAPGPAASGEQALPATALPQAAAADDDIDMIE